MLSSGNELRAAFLAVVRAVNGRPTQALPCQTDGLQPHGTLAHVRTLAIPKVRLGVENGRAYVNGCGTCIDRDGSGAVALWSDDTDRPMTADCADYRLPKVWQPQLLLVLQRRRGRYRLEVLVERGRAHADSPCELRNRDRRTQVPSDVSDGAGDRARVAVVSEETGHRRAKGGHGSAGGAWVLAQGEEVFMIPGTRRIERLKEDLGAWKVQFTAEELADIRSRLPQETAGSRY